tara:strand:- start:286 stop:519 length:234 start_codon:yes stop_codon:yes gene_type:complete
MDYRVVLEVEVVHTLQAELAVLEHQVKVMLVVLVLFLPQIIQVAVAVAQEQQALQHQMALLLEVVVRVQHLPLQAHR